MIVTLIVLSAGARELAHRMRSHSQVRERLVPERISRRQIESIQQRRELLLFKVEQPLDRLERVVGTVDPVQPCRTSECLPCRDLELPDLELLEPGARLRP